MRYNLRRTSRLREAVESNPKSQHKEERHKVKKKTTPGSGIKVLVKAGSQRPGLLRHLQNDNTYIHVIYYVFEYTRFPPTMSRLFKPKLPCESSFES